MRQSNRTSDTDRPSRDFSPVTFRFRFNGREQWIPGFLSRVPVAGEQVSVKFTQPGPGVFSERRNEMFTGRVAEVRWDTGFYDTDGEFHDPTVIVVLA